MVRRIRLLCGLALCAGVLMSTHAEAIDPSGTAVAVVQATNASGPGGSRTLGDAQPVFGGDRIATGSVGQAQILFKDDTRLVVGSNSSVVIDRFVLADSGSKAGATMRFAKGAFRFIGSGGDGNTGYNLQTPSATIGIRSTEFDIAVSPRGTAVLVFEGAVQVCNRVSGKCATIDRSCGAVIAENNGALHLPEAGGETAQLINTSFPLAENQGGLRHDFRVRTTGCRGGDGTERNGKPRTIRTFSVPAPSPEPEPYCGYSQKKAYNKKSGFQTASYSAQSEKTAKAEKKSEKKAKKQKRKKGKKGKRGRKGGRKG